MITLIYIRHYLGTALETPNSYYGNGTRVYITDRIVSLFRQVRSKVEERGNY